MVWAAILSVAVIVLATLQAMRDASLQLKWNQKPVLRSRYVRTTLKSCYVRTTLNTAIAVITVVGMVLLASPAPDIVYNAF